MKTNTGLIEFAKSKLGTPYVYGMKGTVLTLDKYTDLKLQYGGLIWDSDVKKVGQVCCDCSGLISWYTGIVRNSQGYHDTATAVYPISMIATAPLGVAVWQKGHIGVYIGNGEYIAEDGSAYGCRINKISKSGFTHWFEISDIEYLKEDDEMVEESKIIVDDKDIKVKRILKDDTNYIAIRDIAEALGYNISSKGNIAVLSKK